MCGAIPISAMPVAAVRRRSCSRHGGIFIASSRRRFIFDQPLTGDRPVVVKTNPSLPLPTIFRARGARGTTCGRLFLVRAPGMFQVAPSSLNSALRHPGDLVEPATGQQQEFEQGREFLAFGVGCAPELHDLCVGQDAVARPDASGR